MENEPKEQPLTANWWVIESSEDQTSVSSWAEANRQLLDEIHDITAGFEEIFKGKR